jgi:hypothetical protein
MTSCSASGFCRHVKQGTPVYLVIVPEVRTTPSLLRTTFGSHQMILWGGAVEEGEQEGGIADMEEEIEAESGPN